MTLSGISNEYEPGSNGFFASSSPRTIAFNGILYGALVLAVFITLVPIIMMLLTSVKTPDEIARFDYTLPKVWHWANFSEALNVAPFGRFLLNTLVVSTGITILHVFISGMMAYAFARLQFPGRDTLFFMFLATFMIPSQVTLVPQFILVKELGWVDTYAGIIFPQVFTAFGTFFLRQSFLAIPRELDDAAFIDGCSRWGIFWRIILPLSGPALATLALFSFLFHWNNFLWPLVISNSDATTVIAVGLGRFTTQSGTSWNLLMAASTIATFPTVIVFFVAQKWFVQGVLQSGMGGR